MFVRCLLSASRSRGLQVPVLTAYLPYIPQHGPSMLVTFPLRLGVPSQVPFPVCNVRLLGACILCHVWVILVNPLHVQQSGYCRRSYFAVTTTLLGHLGRAGGGAIVVLTLLQPITSKPLPINVCSPVRLSVHLVRRFPKFQPWMQLQDAVDAMDAVEKWSMRTPSKPYLPFRVFVLFTNSVYVQSAVH